MKIKKNTKVAFQGSVYAYSNMLIGFLYIAVVLIGGWAVVLIASPLFGGKLNLSIFT